VIALYYYLIIFLFFWHYLNLSLYLTKKRKSIVLKIKIQKGSMGGKVGDRKKKPA